MTTQRQDTSDEQLARDEGDFTGRGVRWDSSPSLEGGVPESWKGVAIYQESKYER